MSKIPIRPEAVKAAMNAAWDKASWETGQIHFGTAPRSIFEAGYRAALTAREDTQRLDDDSHWATVVINDAFEPREITKAEAEQLYESGIGIDVQRMRIRPGVQDTEREDDNAGK